MRTDLARGHGGAVVALPLRLQRVVSLARFDVARRLVAAHMPLITAGGDEVIVHASWDAVAFYFRDPAGSILECIARRGGPADDPHAPQDPAIRSVCEVGVAVGDVPAMAAMLRAALAVVPFGGSEGETSTALGDEEGLLVVVQRGREWYPSTGLPRPGSRAAAAQSIALPSCSLLQATPEAPARTAR